MAKMFKDQDGSIQEVTGSRAVTREWIEEEIRQAETHLNNLQEMLNDFNVLSGDAPATPVPVTNHQQPEVILADVVVVENPQPVAPAPTTPQPPVAAPVPQDVNPVAAAPQIIPVQPPAQA